MGFFKKHLGMFATCMVFALFLSLVPQGFGVTAYASNSGLEVKLIDSTVDTSGETEVVRWERQRGAERYYIVVDDVIRAKPTFLTNSYSMDVIMLFGDETIEVFAVFPQASSSPATRERK